MSAARLHISARDERLRRATCPSAKQYLCANASSLKGSPKLLEVPLRHLASRAPLAALILCMPCAHDVALYAEQGASSLSAPIRGYRSFDAEHPRHEVIDVLASASQF